MGSIPKLYTIFLRSLGSVQYHCRTYPRLATPHLCRRAMQPTGEIGKACNTAKDAPASTIRGKIIKLYTHTQINASLVAHPEAQNVRTYTPSHKCLHCRQRYRCVSLSRLLRLYENSRIKGSLPESHSRQFLCQHCRCLQDGAYRDIFTRLSSLQK